MKTLSNLIIATAIALAPASVAAARPVTLPQGIVSIDTLSHRDLQTRIHAGFQKEIPWDEAYSNFVDEDVYIPDMDVGFAYNYIQDIQNLKEWTMSAYDVWQIGDLGGKTRYQGVEQLPPYGPIWFLEEKFPEIHMGGWWVGFAADNIWMRYYIRVLDAQEYIGKPGAIITWMNPGHNNFTLDPALAAGFRQMKIAHLMELTNLVKVLKWRYAGNAGELTSAVAAELDLFNTARYDAAVIWSTLASQVTQTVPWSQHYGEFIGSHYYVVDAPADAVWAYLSDLRNMDQWTVSMRRMRETHRGHVQGEERLLPHGHLKGEVFHHPKSMTMDLKLRLADGPLQHRIGHNVNWMNSTIRVLDGPTTNGLPGTVVVWMTYRHRVFETVPQLAEDWRLLPVRNKLSADNVKILLGAD